MSESTTNNIPWILRPFYAMWKLLTLILNITGRIICAVLGLAIMTAGVAATLSIVGAIIGLPLTAFGFLLLIRALF